MAYDGVVSRFPELARRDAGHARYPIFPTPVADEVDEGYRLTVALDLLNHVNSPTEAVCA